ncbi:cAMP-specific 3',5'-cyclic phosphodiesterase 4A [Triplophysa tibetana]|uniref:cAMP-specific 3',5'-cyclic phosphodiesterase 4A n=1 Tax=Triplophysa tibetana TaxID=1572043 RepID=A0A5A9ND77_9TELE|nr:cAMP-specific 3',5'-cyclic phosphodiesterase 4A [Triplophysa tibetana]
MKQHFQRDKTAQPPAQRRRFSLTANALDPRPSYAIRRRFSGPVMLPPLARRHSSLDGRKIQNLEALFKSALASVETQKEINLGAHAPTSVGYALYITQSSLLRLFVVGQTSISLINSCLKSPGLFLHRTNSFDSANALQYVNLSSSGERARFSTGDSQSSTFVTMECSALSREGAGLAKPPKHLWRQPRTHIRIKQRYHSDTEKYLCCNRAVENNRPGLKRPRKSWPSSFHKR